DILPVGGSLACCGARTRVRGHLRDRARNLLGFRRDLLTAAAADVTDRRFAQATYGMDELTRWRDTVDPDGPIDAGVHLIPVARCRETAAPSEADLDRPHPRRG